MMITTLVLNTNDAVQLFLGKKKQDKDTSVSFPQNFNSSPFPQAQYS